VVTDHSPCPPAMKRLHEGSFRTAWVVLQACQVALPLIVDRKPAGEDSHCSISHAGWQQRRLDWLVVTRARVKLPWDTMRISLFFRFRPGIRCDPRQIALPTSDLSVFGRNAARRGEGYLSARESRLRRRKVSRRTKRSGILACVIIIDRLDKAHQLLPHNFRDVEARSGLHYPIRGSWLPAGPQMNSDRIVDSIIGKSVPRKEGRGQGYRKVAVRRRHGFCHTCSSERRFAAKIPRGCINKITFAPGFTGMNS